MKINTHVLREVAYQLEHGNAWWGIALGNKYLEKDALFRKALVKRFISRIGETAAQSPLAKALIAGDGTDSLTAAQQERLGTRVVRETARICSPRLRQAHHQRLAVRTRLGASQRFTGRDLTREATRRSSAIRELKVVGAFGN
jgi:hypothetical protein